MSVRGKPKPRRVYTEADIATALASLKSNGGSINATASQLGIPRATLTKWRDGKGGVTRVTHEQCQVKEEEISVLFERACRVYLGRALEQSAVDDSKGKDAIIAAATALDKMRLIHDQPTAINRNEKTYSYNVVYEVVPCAGTADTGLPETSRLPAIDGQI